MKRFHISPKESKKDITLIIDGKYLAYRTKYSKNNNQLFHNNIKTGLYYGFFNTLKSLGKQFNPVNTIIMWDSDSSQSVRKKTFPGYKKKDWSKLSEEEQFELKQFNEEYINLIDFCTSCGFAGYYLEGYEADDLIALYVRQFNHNTNIIVTKDEDMYQCLNNYSYIFDPDKKTKKTVHWFKKEYGIKIEDWIMVKALAGCKSDMIPGLPGIGEKTAIDIINGIASDKIKKKVGTSEAISLINAYLKLVTLPHPSLKEKILPFKLTKFKTEVFIELCQILNFKSFLDKLYEFDSFI